MQSEAFSQLRILLMLLLHVSMIQQHAFVRQYTGSAELSRGMMCQQALVVLASLTMLCCSAGGRHSSVASLASLSKRAR